MRIENTTRFLMRRFLGGQRQTIRVIRIFPRNDDAT